MAARLVRRCCRGWRPLGAFLCPAAPGGQCQGKVPPTRAAPPASFLRSLAEGSWAQQRAEEGGAPEQRRALGELIEAARSPQELYQLCQLHPLSSNEASLAIARLSRLAAQQGLDTRSILRDQGFQQLLSITDSQISQVWNTSLVQLLRSLYWLGLESGQRELLSVEQEVLWRLRRFSYPQLAALAQLLAPRPGGQGRLLAEVVRKLELRWTELEGTRSVVGLICRVGGVSPTLMERLEDKALELAEQFSPEEIRRVTLALAVQRRRCVPLLRALAHHLSLKQGELSPALLSDLIFAYGKLNFQQPQVLQKISSELQPHVGTMSPGEVTRCARSFSLLNWLSLPFCEAVAQYALDNRQQLSVAHLCGIILSFARLNFQPSGSEDFFNMVHEELQGQLGSLEPALLTELVWSLCVLQQARVPYLQAVLAPNFYPRIRDDPSLKAKNLLLKLVHINTTARLETPQYRGPFLPAEVLSPREPPGDRVTLLQSSLREALGGLLGGWHNGRFDLHTLHGWHIDAEVVLSSEHKPLPVKDFVAPHLPQSEGTKPLPPGARRVAFLRWEFSSFSSRGRELLGRCAMARRHLGAAGFLLVDVPHYEFLELKLERQRAAYLRDKLHKALAKQMAS